MKFDQLMDSQLKDMLIAYSSDFVTKFKCLIVLTKRKLKLQ